MLKFTPSPALKKARFQGTDYIVQERTDLELISIALPKKHQNITQNIIKTYHCDHVQAGMAIQQKDHHLLVLNQHQLFIKMQSQPSLSAKQFIDR
ncbi:MAG: hypothetical protein AAF403_02210, partial [Pseudomonadota bacterium]